MCDHGNLDNVTKVNSVCSSDVDRDESECEVNLTEVRLFTSVCLINFYLPRSVHTCPVFFRTHGFSAV